MARNWGYPNGRIPDGAMSLVRGEYFQPNAADHLRSLEAEFSRVFGHEFPITQGYRPLGSQGDTSSNTQWGAWYIYQTQGRPVAARPGTSNHGDGCAADVGGAAGTFNTTEHNWLVQNAPRFGWAWGSTPSEPWHFDYTGPLTVTAGSGGSSTPISTPTQEDDDMPRLYWTTSGTGYFGVASVGTIPQFQVLQRYCKSQPGAEDKFNEVERGWIQNYLAINNAYGIPAANAAPTFDVAKLASALSDALNAKGVAVNATSLTAPLDAAFSRSLAAIGKAAADQTTAKLAFDPVKLSSAISEAVGDKLVHEGVVATVDPTLIQNAVSAAIGRATQAIAAATQAGTQGAPQAP